MRSDQARQLPGIAGQAQPLRALDSLGVEVRGELRPDALHLPQEDVGARRPQPRDLLQLPAQRGDVTAGRLPHPPQIAAADVQQQRGAVTELGGGALVVAPVAALRQGVDPLLPGRHGHPPRGAQSRVEQGAGGRHRHGRADARAEQPGQHQHLVQRLRGVAQPDPALGGEGLAVPLQQGVRQGPLPTAAAHGAVPRGPRGKSRGRVPATMSSVAAVGASALTLPGPPRGKRPLLHGAQGRAADLPPPMPVRGASGAPGCRRCRQVPRSVAQWARMRSVRGRAHGRRRTGKETGSPARRERPAPVRPAATVRSR